MSRYAILPHESANRVYATEAPDMLAAELTAVSSVLSIPIRDVAVETLGRLEYVTFTTDSDIDGGDGTALTADDRAVLSDLSTTRALFAVDVDARFTPIDYTPTAYFDEDLVTIQRYPGKTNEQFTHLVVNLAFAASDAAQRRIDNDQPVRLLDPVAGRGTTLNRGLMYGFDVTGVEATAADEDQYRSFIRGYLKDHRIKHTNAQETVKHGPLAGTSRFKIEIQRRQRLEFVHGDTAELASLLPNKRFDLIVADLPYGVQHRAASTQKSRRSPVELMHEAIGGWVDAMPVGAAIGLAWNLHTMARAELASILTTAGLHLVDYPVSFEHVVDRSITRDVIVATK